MLVAKTEGKPLVYSRIYLDFWDITDVSINAFLRIELYIYIVYKKAGKLNGKNFLLILTTITHSVILDCVRNKTA